MDYAGYQQKQFGANLYRLKEKLPDFLEREMGLSAKKHFRCLNPAHEDRHPSMSYYPAGQCVKCFSCGFTGDLLTVAGLYWGISDEKEIIPRLLQYYPDCRCSTSNKAEISSYLLQRGLSEDIIRWSGAVEVQMSYSAVQCVCPIIREIMRRTGRFQRNVSVNRRVSRSRFVFQNFCRNLVLFFWLRPISVRFRSISVGGRRSLQWSWLSADFRGAGQSSAAFSGCIRSGCAGNAGCRTVCAGLCRNGRCGGDCGSFWAV